MKKITAIIILLMLVNQAYAFKLGIHEAITDLALQQYGFDEETRQMVVAANRLVDTSPAAFSTAAHADNNNLNGASARLKEKKDRIIANLKACNRGGAVIELGRALHTVQDLYSHTNAVDNNITIDESNLLHLTKGTAIVMEKIEFMHQVV